MLTVNGLVELLSELLKGGKELLLLLSLTQVPVLVGQSLHKWLVDLVDHGVEDWHDMLGDLSKQNLVIIGSIWVDCLAVWCGSEEVDSLASEFEGLT